MCAWSCLGPRLVDTTTPAGRALFQMLGVLSEFEDPIAPAKRRARASRSGSGSVIFANGPVVFSMLRLYP